MYNSPIIVNDAFWAAGSENGIVTLKELKSPKNFIHNPDVTSAPQELFDGIPEKETLVKLLNEIKSLDLSSASQQEILEAYFSRVHFLGLQPIYVARGFIEPEYVWRVRREVQSSENKNIVKPFTYPETVSRNGRANVSGEPVFYCTDDVRTSVLESKVKPNEMIYLSMWEIKCDRNLLVCNFLPAGLPEENEVAKSWGKTYKAIEAHNSNSWRNKKEEIVIINNFWAERFKNENAPYYSLSSWLANRTLYEGEADYIQYSSTETSHESCNMAINRNFVNRYMSLVKVYEIWINEANHKQWKVQLMRVGDQKNNVVEWHAPQIECNS